MEHTIQTGVNNPVLRASSVKVEQFDNELRKLEKDMLKIMKDKEGVGIAAPQVGEDLRMIICKFDQKKATTLINPEIASASKETVVGLEGCLSLPGVWGKVERHEWVVVKFQNIKGNEVKLRLEGFAARVAQHEIDHLNGVLFSDLVIGEFEVDAKTDLKALGLEPEIIA